MESGQSLSTCIGKGRDDKAREWGLGLQLCFVEDGTFKKCSKEK
jgi:hypothetical protein